MFRLFNGLLLVLMLSMPMSAMAGGKEKTKGAAVESEATLFIEMTGLERWSKSDLLSTRVMGVNPGQSLAVEVQPPSGTFLSRTITLKPGANRLQFDLSLPESAKPKPTPAPQATVMPKPAPTVQAAAPTNPIPTPKPAPAPQAVVMPKPAPTAQAAVPSKPIPTPKPAPVPQVRVAVPSSPPTAEEAPAKAPQAEAMPALAPAPVPTPAPAPSPRLEVRSESTPVPSPAKGEEAPATSPQRATPPVPAVFAGRTVRDCPFCPELVEVPAGSFVIGRDDRSGERSNRRVIIDSPLLIGRHEVTRGEWAACVTDGVCATHASETSAGLTDHHPIGNVNFADAKRYLRWLSEKTGKTYRLPTEAEWEYAARGGTTTTYWWGNEPGHNNANCFGCGSRWDGRGPAPVGSFNANPFGLFDTSGNVWEWVEDCFEPSALVTFDRYPSAVPGDAFCDHVLRGGGWDIFPDGVRGTFRFNGDPQNRQPFYGFRVVRE